MPKSSRRSDSLIKEGTGYNTRSKAKRTRMEEEKKQQVEQQQLPLETQHQQTVPENTDESHAEESQQEYQEEEEDYDEEDYPEESHTEESQHHEESQSEDENPLRRLLDRLHGSNLRPILESLQSDDPSIRFIGLQDLNEQLSMASDPDLPIEAILPLLLQNFITPDLTLLACRCLLNLVDLYPIQAIRYTIIKHDIVKALCALEMEDFDIIEIWISILEKISQVDWKLLECGGVEKLLNYYDFFPIDMQRRIVGAIGNSIDALSSAPSSGDWSSFSVFVPRLLDLVGSDEKISELVVSGICKYIHVLIRTNKKELVEKEWIDALFRHASQLSSGNVKLILKVTSKLQLDIGCYKDELRGLIKDHSSQVVELLLSSLAKSELDAYLLRFNKLVKIKGLSYYGLKRFASQQAVAVPDLLLSHEEPPQQQSEATLPGGFAEFIEDILGIYLHANDRGLKLSCLVLTNSLVSVSNDEMKQLLEDVPIAEFVSKILGKFSKEDALEVRLVLALLTSILETCPEYKQVLVRQGVKSELKRLYECFIVEEFDIAKFDTLKEEFMKLIDSKELDDAAQSRLKAITEEYYSEFDKNFISQLVTRLNTVLEGLDTVATVNAKLKDIEKRMKDGDLKDFIDLFHENDTITSFELVESGLLKQFLSNFDSFKEQLGKLYDTIFIDKLKECLSRLEPFEVQASLLQNANQPPQLLRRVRIKLKGLTDNKESIVSVPLIATLDSLEEFVISRGNPGFTRNRLDSSVVHTIDPEDPSSRPNTAPSSPTTQRFQFSIGGLLIPAQLNSKMTAYGLIHRFESVANEDEKQRVIESLFRSTLSPFDNILTSIYTVEYTTEMRDGNVFQFQKGLKVLNIPSEDVPSEFEPAPVNYLTVLKILERLYDEDHNQRFIMTNLASKFIKQVKDELLMTCSGLTPFWTRILLKHAPFLIPLEHRLAYLQLTSFGLKRYLHHQNIQIQIEVQQHQPPNPLIHLSRQKIKLDRKKLLESGVKIMKQYANTDYLMEIEYFEEVGSGLGVTLEFYSLLDRR